MKKQWRVRVLGLVKASHFGPTVLVVTISFLLSLSQFSTIKSLEIAFAILAGQFVVGWTNDLLDYPLDLAAGRKKKPLVAGDISQSFLKNSIFIALIFALTLSLMGPLSFKGTSIHALGIASATAYNFGLKKTLVSLLPYVISFGAMPWAVYVAAGRTPPAWLYLGFIAFASAFHFLNVLKDLNWDISQGVLGLPQRLGKRKSIAIAACLVVGGLFDVAVR
jgi:4-hydroxybenzoate polyprenyltransferase